MRNQFTVDLLRENEIEQQLEEGTQRFVDGAGLELLAHDVAAQNLSKTVNLGSLAERNMRPIFLPTPPNQNSELLLFASIFTQ